MKLKIYSFEGSDYPKGNYLNVSWQDVLDLIHRARMLEIAIDFDKYIFHLKYHSSMTGIRNTLPTATYAGMTCHLNQTTLYHNTPIRLVNSSLRASDKELKIKLKV